MAVISNINLGLNLMRACVHKTHCVHSVREKTPGDQSDPFPTCRPQKHRMCSIWRSTICHYKSHVIGGLMYVLYRRCKVLTLCGYPVTEYKRQHSDSICVASVMTYAVFSCTQSMNC